MNDDDIDWDGDADRAPDSRWPDDVPVDIAIAINNTAAYPEMVNRCRWTDDQLQWSRDGGETWEME